MVCGALLQLGHVLCGEVGGVDPVEVGVAGGGLSRAQLRQACPCLSGQGSFSFVDYRGGAVDDLVVRLFPEEAVTQLVCSVLMPYS